MNRYFNNLEDAGNQSTLYNASATFACVSGYQLLNDVTNDVITRNDVTIRCTADGLGEVLPPCTEKGYIYICLYSNVFGTDTGLYCRHLYIRNLIDRTGEVTCLKYFPGLDNLSNEQYLTCFHYLW